MRLFLAEMRKIWGNRTFLLLLTVLVFANLLLLWMGTRPAANQPTASAYHAAAQELSGLTMEEKGELLHSRYSDAEGLLKMEPFFRESANQNPAWLGYRERNEELFQKYEQRYLEHDYSLYTGTLTGDYILYSKLLGEYDVVANYSDFLKDVQEKAIRLSGLSIFQNEQSDFERESILQTAEVYENLQGTRIDYYPQKGLYTAISYAFTDLFLLAAAALLALLLVRQERDNGLFSLIRTLPDGRLVTAVVKLEAFAISLLAILLVFYGVNLAYCGVSFGLGPLSRSIQSVPALMRCTLKVTVGQYLGLFLLAKWAGVLVMGLWVMFAMLAARNVVTSWAGALALPLAMYGIRWIIPATGKLNVIKFANLASLLQTNELLGIYRNLYWFDRPVSLPFVEWTAAIIFGLAFGTAFCVLFSRAQLSHSPMRRKIFCMTHKTHAVTIFREEGKKLFWMNGTAFLLAAFLLFNIYQVSISENFLDAEEIYYANYMNQLSGPWTSQSYAQILQFGEEFEPMLETQRQVAAGKLSQYALTEYAPLQQKYEIYTQIIQNNINSYLKEHPKAWLVYETGYRRLFGLNGNTDLYDTLYAGLLCAFCFSGLFAMERKSGMDVILRCTPQGRSKTIYMKLLQSSIAAVAIALAVSLPHLCQVLQDYGLPAMFAPAMSISDFENIPQCFTLSDLLIFWLICRIAACMGMGIIALWLGQKMGNSLIAAFFSAIVFCLPSLLALSGMENGIEWLSFFPFFHALSLCSTQGISAKGIPYSFAWIIWLLLLFITAGIWALILDLKIDYE